MVERPILFNGEMVRAILDGQKTVTRRAIKPGFPSSVKEVLPYVAYPASWMPRDPESPDEAWEEQVRICPYGQPGDQLWVRETFRDARTAGAGRVLYKASGDVACGWKPSIHMPRNCSRIQLEVTAVRVERLHGISNEQCIAEGCKGGHGSIPGYIYNATPQEHFRHVWESAGGDYFANPWVWVVEFNRLEVAHG
ncbi:hypothetical protein [Stutzerimonas zhaodongensis]|uniref:hypothetical protein n=1 Tax=Stutzerimonas zhaodongensis TaxID=1176257 RepID=UPI001F4E43F9|nr:hypothetical protein [Stutzerimonas zhaodongensis]UNG19268.1 hypothetical protein MKP10_03130 [Stutzerimonas zhaodongensis]